MFAFRDFARGSEIGVAPRAFFIGGIRRHGNVVRALVRSCDRGRRIAGNGGVSGHHHEAAVPGEVGFERGAAIFGRQFLERWFEEGEIVRRRGEDFAIDEAAHDFVGEPIRVPGGRSPGGLFELVRHVGRGFA